MECQTVAVSRDLNDDNNEINVTSINAPCRLTKPEHGLVDSLKLPPILSPLQENGKRVAITMNKIHCDDEDERIVLREMMGHPALDTSR